MRQEKKTIGNGTWKKGLRGGKCKNEEYGKRKEGGGGGGSEDMGKGNLSSHGRRDEKCHCLLEFGGEGSTAKKRWGEASCDLAGELHLLKGLS